MSKDSSFAYAIGRIRAIEKRLLDKGKFDRMIESKTPEEAIKVVAKPDMQNHPPFPVI